VEASTPAGSATEGSGKLVEKRATKRRLRTTTNTSLRGGEKRKKTRTTTEEGEDEEEMFGVLKAMAEEQRDVLGMLTQSLAQLSEQLAASEAREVEQLEIKRERLALERRRSAREDERIEMERARLEIEQQRVEDMWRLGTLVRAPFVQGSSTGSTWRELEAAKTTDVEKGAEADDEDGMADAEGEDD